MMMLMMLVMMMVMMLAMMMVMIMVMMLCFSSWQDPNIHSTASAATCHLLLICHMLSSVFLSHTNAFSLEILYYNVCAKCEIKANHFLRSMIRIALPKTPVTCIFISPNKCFFHQLFQRHQHPNAHSARQAWSSHHQIVIRILSNSTKISTNSERLSSFSGHMPPFVNLPPAATCTQMLSFVRYLTMLCKLNIS